jgi:hypothetical protein
MPRIRTLLLCAAVALPLGSGAVLAQSALFLGPAHSQDSHLDAAQQALQDALTHLGQVTHPQSRENVRAMEFIQRAQAELRAEGALYPAN